MTAASKTTPLRRKWGASWFFHCYVGVSLTVAGPPVGIREHFVSIFVWNPWTEGDIEGDLGSQNELEMRQTIDSNVWKTRSEFHFKLCDFRRVFSSKFQTPKCRRGPPEKWEPDNERGLMRLKTCVVLNKIDFFRLGIRGFPAKYFVFNGLGSLVVSLIFFISCFYLKKYPQNNLHFHQCSTI